MTEVKVALNTIKSLRGRRYRSRNDKMDGKDGRAIVPKNEQTDRVPKTIK